VDADIAQRVSARELGCIGRTAVPFAQEVDTIHLSLLLLLKTNARAAQQGCEARSKRGIIAQWCSASDNSRSATKTSAHELLASADRPPHHATASCHDRIHGRCRH